MINSLVDFTRTRLDIPMKGREVGGNFTPQKQWEDCRFHIWLQYIYIYLPTDWLYY